MVQKDLKIVIVGVGGVGGYIGAKLTQQGYDVTLVARGKQFETIQAKGLTVNDNGETFIVRPKIVHTEDHVTLNRMMFDIVFMATKSYDFESACMAIKGSLQNSTLIIPLANGVNHKSKLKNYLPDGVFCDGCVYILSHTEGYGRIHKKNNNFYLLFGADKEDEKFIQLEALLNACELKTKYSRTVLYDCWKKYLFIASFASLTSFFDQSIGYVVTEQRVLLDAILDEIKMLANALDVPISEEDIAKVIRQGQTVPYDAKTSMQLDFEKNKKTELEVLCGYIVANGKHLGISVTNTEKVYEALQLKVGGLTVPPPKKK